MEDIRKTIRAGKLSIPKEEEEDTDPNMMPITLL